MSSGTLAIIVVFFTMYLIFTLLFVFSTIIADSISSLFIFSLISSYFEFDISISYPVSTFFRLSSEPSNIFSSSTITNLSLVSSPFIDFSIFGILNPTTIIIRKIMVDIMKDFLFIISFIVNFITTNKSFILFTYLFYENVI